MYIRTKCGMILRKQGDNRYYTSDNKKSYKSNGISLWGINNTIMGSKSIKSQGDNLIDVLELQDLILNRATGQLVEVTKWLLQDDDWIMLIEDMFNKVITHDHYMKLAQEIK